MYPEFHVQGVPDDQVWQLFNVGNFEYYCLKVENLIGGVCPFCTIDPAVNKVLFENQSWRVWKNKVSPKSGQAYQFIIPSKRHIERVGDLQGMEAVHLIEAIQWIDRTYDITGGAFVIRSGDPVLNAKSEPHCHVNYQVPTGIDRVEVTIAKSQEDLVKKLRVIRVFEKMRVAEKNLETHSGFATLTPEEQDLVRDKLVPKETTGL